MQSRLTKRQLRETRAGYLFILPNLAGFLVFTLFPVGFSLVLSFMNWNLTDFSFAGLQNYIEIFTRDELFFKVLSNTLYYMILCIPAGFALALILALALNQGLKGTVFFRSVFFLPIVISFIASSMIWGFMLNKEFGLVNYILFKFFKTPEIAWLTDERFSMPAVVLVALWHDTGYNMTIMLAGLQTIPRQLYEAADIDGAGKWQKFRKVTLPMLYPTLFFMTVMAIIGTFQVFDVIYALTSGGPFNSTRTYVMYLYTQGFGSFRMGYASALAWIMFVIIFIFTLIQFKFQRDDVMY
jgi:multiple sugar transport system permease protein